MLPELFFIHAFGSPTGADKRGRSLFESGGGRRVVRLPVRKLRVSSSVVQRARQITGERRSVVIKII